MGTRRAQVLAYLQEHPVALDDDQLAAALGVRRQAINPLCRALAAEGAILRSYDALRHKLVNRAPATAAISQHAESSGQHTDRPMIRVAGPLVALMSADAVRAFAYQGELGLSEDSVKAAVQYVLERDGWTTRVQYGHSHGPDIDATRESERLILEVKGEGSRDAMRVNYFLGALGELLQRMDSPAGSYGLALPAHRQFSGLIMRLPDWVCRQLSLRFYLVRPAANGLEVGIIPPRG